MERGLLIAVLLVPASSWSIPGLVGLPGSLPRLDGLVEGWQEQLLQGLWDQHKDNMGYCVGNKLSDAKQLLKESFPSPLPTGPEDDSICSNSTLLMAHLCSPQELKFYMKVSCCPVWQLLC
jgi:hypothetical protein